MGTKCYIVFEGAGCAIYHNLDGYPGYVGLRLAKALRRYSNHNGWGIGYWVVGFIGREAQAVKDGAGAYSALVAIVPVEKAKAGAECCAADYVYRVSVDGADRVEVAVDEAESSDPPKTTTMDLDGFLKFCVADDRATPFEKNSYEIV